MSIILPKLVSGKTEVVGTRKVLVLDKVKDFSQVNFVYVFNKESYIHYLDTNRLD